MVSSISSAAQTQAVDQLFKKADSNSDGKLTKAELTTALEAAGDSAQVSKAKADDFFKMLDTANQGYVTKQDVTTGLQSQQAPGARPAGPPPGGGGAGKTEDSSSTDSTDPADTNGDGKVSMDEEMAYLLKQYLEGSATTQSTSTVSTYA